MNIQVQICGLAIIILLLILYNTQKVLPLFAKRLFIITLITSLASISLDIMSIVFIHYRSELPLWLVNTVCKLYLSSLIITAMNALFYALMGIVVEYKRRSFAVMLWTTSWTVAAITQFLHNEFLLIGFASAIGMVILYTMLESPDGNLDKQLRCFNSYAFEVYCRDMKYYGKKFAVLEISVMDDQLFNDRDIDPVVVGSDIISWISHNCNDALIFKNVSYSFYVASDDPEKLVALLDKLPEIPELPDFIEQCSFNLVGDSDCFYGSFDLSQIILYAKRSTADRAGKLISVTKDMIADFREESRIADEIKNALIEDKVLVYLQPIYSIATGKFETAEALVRMCDRDGRIISPGVFIPVAEKSGQIVKLGERIFEKVCHFISTSDLRGAGVSYIEVNLSVVQCEREELADSLIDIIKKYNISSDQLNFEITESGSIKARIPFLTNINKLQSHGATFSLDDFGKGESNLMYLIDMPVSIVKMDYDLTKSYYENEKAHDVVNSVVALAHSMGMKIVAEGIETKEEFDVFRGAGVDYIQGYYFARPMPEEEYLHFVRTKNA